MRLEYQILAAVVLDLLVGDPQWLPHPVRLIGRFAMGLEAPARRLPGCARGAGIATVIVVVGVTGVASIVLVWAAGLVHPAAADVVSVLLIYFAVAARDLAHHGMAVFRALRAGDLPEARRRAGRIVGRDTDRLDEPEIVRAAVESVAESTVDGVTAPLFFAVLFGPAGAMAYRAINTLDSTFGYKDERYLKFGWASARLDDAANFVPARLTAPLVSVAAAVMGQRPGLSLRIMRRDGRKHASPNAGLAEAAMAGAMGVQLGGLNYYGGEPAPKPTIGDPVVRLARRHILTANALMFVTAGLFVLMCLAARIGVLHVWQSWRAGT